MTARPARSRPAPPPRKPRFSLHGTPEIGPSEKRLWTRLAWGLAALVSLALLAVALGPHRVGDYFTETDFYGAYAQGARLVEHGRLIPARYGVIGPGYEVALGLLGFLVPDLFLAAELLSILSAGAILVLWFHLLAPRAGERVAFLATVFMAANAHFFHHGYIAATDTFAIALQGTALYLLLGHASPRSVAAAGLVAALAFLTRYNSIYLLPAGLIAVLGGGTRFQPRSREALLFTAGFLAPVVPWVLYSLARGGGFSFQLHHNIAYEVFARARGITWDEYQQKLQPQFKSLWDVIRRDPGAVSRRLLFNAGDHLRLDAQSLLGWPTAIAALIGAAVSVRDGSMSRLWPLVVAAGLLSATLVPVFYSERYSLGMLPLYATLAATAFASPLGALVVGRKRRLWLKPLLASVPLAFAVMASWRLERRAIDQLPVEVLECARTLRQLEHPGDRVIARKGHIAYHAGAEPLPFPFTNTIPELADYAHRHQARWLYFSWPEAETRPQYFFLLDTSSVVPGLRPRKVTAPHPAVLYEIGPEFGAIPDWFANDTLHAWHNVYGQLLVDANNPKLLYDFGGLSQLLGRSDVARGALVRAARLDPRNPDIPLLLGSVLLDASEFDAAERAFERAEALNPDNLEARLGRGWATLLAGREQEAAALWRPVIGATRKRPVLESMIQLYARLGDREAEGRARAALAGLGPAR